jgi:WD40 repeat protein
MADRVGQQIGNFILTRLLGRGGFADVYLAEQRFLKTQAAIKVLHTRLTPADLQRFQTEAQIIAHLQHPHIVRVLDFGVDTGAMPYLIMEYAPNGTLRQRHPKGLCLSPSIILLYTKQVAKALAYVHAQKLVHQDIKPENMLLGSQGEILLSDFGVAVAVQTQQLQNVYGTSEYIAPEQSLGRPCPASDQYSLGVTIYEWLCGKCPFHGSNPRELAHKHAILPPPPLRGIIPTISPALEDVILKALAKDPKDRFASLLDFAEAFEQAVQNAQHNVLGTAGTVALSPAMASTSPLPGQPTPGGNSTATTLILPRNIPTQPLSSPVSSTTPLYQKEGIGKTMFIYEEHTDFVQTVAWSPDGTRIASGGDDRQVHVWNATTGQKLFIYSGHADQVWKVAWSPDGKWIASASVDQLIHIWESASGNKYTSFQGHFEQALNLALVCTLAWSPDGTRIASGGADWNVQVWEVGNGKVSARFQGHDNDVNAIAWPPDGKQIATASDDKTVRIWDVDSARHIHTYSGHIKSVHTVAWSPDGQYLASGGNDATVQVWDASSAGRSFLFTYQGHTKRVRTLGWSPDGRYIASGGSDKTAQVWDALTGHQLFIYSKHTGHVNSLTWSPNGKYVASAGDDETIHIWQAQ